MDIDKIEPGVDFTEVISKSLECCDVMLAVIGPNWQGINEAKNTSRIKDENDWVRLEIANALNRNIRVVPVLVDGATLPASEELPDDLQPLLRRQAYEISNKRWRYDTDQLIEFLQKMGILPHIVPAVIPVKKSSKISEGIKKLLIGVGGFFVFIMILYYGFGVGNEEDSINKHDLTPDKDQQIFYNDSVHIPGEEGVEKLVNNSGKKVIENNSVNINGTWYDANELYYMIFKQNGNELDVKSYALTGQKTGEGIGTINGSTVTFKIAIENFGILSAKAKVSSDWYDIKGTTSIENNGSTYSEPFHLIKE